MGFTNIRRELRDQGLLDFSSEVPHLTDKGRDYLEVLEDARTQEVADIGDDASDLVLATSGLIR